MFSRDIFPFSPWSFLTCQLLRVQTLASCNTNKQLVMRQKVRQVTPQAPNTKCRLSGEWPSVQACFISNYRKWWDFLIFQNMKIDMKKKWLNVICSPTPGPQISALICIFFKSINRTGLSCGSTQWRSTLTCAWCWVWSPFRWISALVLDVVILEIVKNLTVIRIL